MDSNDCNIEIKVSDDHDIISNGESNDLICNTLNKKRQILDKAHNQLMNIFEISSSSNIPSDFTLMTLRDILTNVNKAAREFDEFYLQNTTASNDSENKDPSAVKTKEISSSLATATIYQSTNNFQHVTKLTRANASSRAINEEFVNKRGSAINRKNSLLLTNNQDHSDYQATNILRLRDLRRLDFQFNPEDEPNVLVRRHVVLLSFDPIRALIMADRLFVIVKDGSDSELQILEDHINEWKQGSKNIPFESHAYESILSTINSIKTRLYDSLSNDVRDNLKFFKDVSILPIEIQEKMRILKNSVLAMKSTIIGYKRIILDLLEDDEDMALMNLTRLRNNPNLYKVPLVNEILNTHEETEELLESYLMDYNSLESKLESLRVQMQSAEELVLLRLDTSRNELLSANTSMAVLACCIGFGAYITGIFGMNLDQTIWLLPIRGVFMSVFSVTFALIFVSYFAVMYYYKITGVLPKKITYNKNDNKNSYNKVNIRKL